MGTKDKYEPAYRLIVDGLIAHRKAIGMTQCDLALAFGTDQSQISKFERGERRIDILDYLRLCRVMNISPARLLDEAMHAL